ncbi:MAG: hypothetical protein RMH84_05890 [Sulfolobales archaeon]|nr:hypothetical protein [Sulfolobales archaeon]
MSRWKLVLVLVVVSALIRILPPLVAGSYFSTDVWPLIKSTSKIVENPEIKIWNHEELGDYHNRWPASILSGAVYSVITGSDSSTFFRYTGVTTISICLTLLTYATLAKFVGERRAFASSLALSALPSFTVFTSVVLKEVYSYPIAASITSIFVSNPGRVTWVVALLLSLALVTSHPLTPLVLASAIASYVFCLRVKEVRLREKRGELHAVLLSTALLLIYSIYGAIYAWEGLAYKLGPQDVLSLVAIAVVVYGWYALNRGSDVVSSLVVTPLALAAIVTGLTGVLKLSLLPYVLAPATLLLTLLKKEPETRNPVSLVPSSINLPVATATLHIFLAQPVLIPIAYRILNYLTYPAVLSLSTVKLSSRVIAYVQLAALAFGLAYSAAALAAGDPTIYYWVYREPEVVGLMSTSRYFNHVCGDAKVYYLVSMESGVEVGSLCGIEVLRELKIVAPLILYLDNFRYGYVLSQVDVLPVSRL